MFNINFGVVFDRMHRSTPQKCASVEFRFTCRGKQKYVSTGIKLFSTQWSKKKECVIKHDDAVNLNKMLGSYKKRAYELVEKFSLANDFDLERLVKVFAGADESSMTFLDYCKKRRSERKVCEHTKKRYDVFIKFLGMWGKIVAFADCNISNIRAMDEFLHKEGKAQCTIYDYHKYLKLFINDAVIDGLVDKNPYEMLPFHIGKGEKQYVDCITEEQFNAIKELHIATPHIQRARDLFLFQCYTGLAYSDLMSFDYSNCEEIGGKWFYHAKRTKTDTDFVFQLLTPAVDLLKSYEFKLPHISNQRYNDYLKVIGQMAGIERLHSHMGRATAATLFLSKGMPINIVARVLGHTTLRQTTRYARTLNKDVCSAFDSLEGKI